MSHFDYIADPIIKKELDELNKYIVWLSKKFSQETDADILLSIKKDIFIHIGSTIEALLFLVAKKLCGTDKALKTMDYTKAKEIHRISDDERIIYHTEKQIALDPNKTDFHSLIEAISKTDGFVPEMKEDMTKIRKMRNSVHVNTGILCNDDFINMNITEYKNSARSVLVYCKAKLTE